MVVREGESVCQKEYICVKGCVRECKFLFEKERMCVC